MSPKLLLAALPFIALGACVPGPEPTPAPAPAPAPTPTPTPIVQAPPPFAGNWIDAPVTPGDWTYSAGTARFGTAGGTLLTLRCDRAAGMVELVRTGSTSAALPIVVRTETLERSLNATPGTAGVATRLGARDPLLDAMAFSRGRFAVESGGMTPLYVPAWPEVTRVIEDCR